MQGSLRRALSEPLLQFLVVGALVFGLHAAAGGSGDTRSVIEVPVEMVRGVRDEFLLRKGAPAKREDLEAAVRQYVESEVLFREAERWDLGRGDPIVRRRLVQKMRFVVEDGAQVDAPTPGELRAFFEDDPARFTRAATSSFDHIYLSSDRRTDSAVRAEEILRTLGESDAAWQQHGDGFLWGASFEALNEERLVEMLGPDAAARIGALETGAWRGPVRSPFGLHLVRVRERKPARIPSFEEARTEAYQAYLEDHRAAARRAAIDELLESYEVKVEYPELQVAGLGK